MLRFESMLLEADAHDARAAAVAESVWQRKYDENRELFAAVFAGSMRPEDDFDEAYDVFFALNSAAFVRVLVDDRGWTFDTYERWTATMLRRLFHRVRGLTTRSATATSAIVHSARWQTQKSARSRLRN